MAKVSYDAKLQRIVDTATGVFLARGIEHTTLDSIAEVLGYTKQAIYYYYKNKEELVIALCKSILTNMNEAVQGVVDQGGSAKEMTRKMLELFFKTPESYRGFFQVYTSYNLICEQISKDEPKGEINDLMKFVPKTFQKLVADGMKAGDFAKGDADAIGEFFFGMVNGVLMRMNFNDDYSKSADAVSFLMGCIEK